MARVTVEDCVEVIPNRFELVVLAAQRSREVSAGAQLTRERDNDKNPVVALREIAGKTVDPKELDEALIQSLQKHFETDEPEEDDMAMLMSSGQWATGVESPAGTSNVEIGSSPSEPARDGWPASAGPGTPSEPASIGPGSPSKPASTEPRPASEPASTEPRPPSEPASTEPRPPSEPASADPGTPSKPVLPGAPVKANDDSTESGGL